MRCLIVVAFWLCCFLQGAYGAEEIRTWTAVSGNKVEAAFVRAAGASVILELGDGKQVKIAKSRLSRADNAYLVALSTPPPQVHELPFDYGKTSQKMLVRTDDTVSYHMFVPESLKMQKAWPVLFVFSPGGGNPGTLKRYIPGAERNAWALVVSVESANSCKRPSAEVINAMVDDVTERYPIDKKRIYASGHSGGSREAGLLGEHMRKRDFAGLLANGAGVGYGRVYVQSPKSSIYALCGSNCFNRWDMPTSLSRIKCKNKKLVIFPGNHDWASAAYMTEGMSTLTGWFLKDARSMQDAYAAERKRFVERQLEEIESLKAAHPGKALIWTQLLSEFRLPMELAARVRKEHAALRSNKAALQYIEAEKALADLMTKHFVVKDVARCMKRADPAASKAALALAEQYADTPLAEVFSRLAKPSI
jgi:hypothetical protein